MSLRRFPNKSQTLTMKLRPRQPKRRITTPLERGCLHRAIRLRTSANPTPHRGRGSSKAAKEEGEGKLVYLALLQYVFASAVQCTCSWEICMSCHLCAYSVCYRYSAHSATCLHLPLVCIRPIKDASFSATHQNNSLINDYV